MRHVPLPNSGAVWGGAGGPKDDRRPHLLFLGSGLISGYLGGIHAASLDLEHSNVVRVLRARTGPLSLNTVLIFTPSAKGPETTSEQLREELEALSSAAACCLVISKVRQLPQAECLNTSTRRKVRLILFEGPETSVSTKAIGIHFPHLRSSDSIYEPAQHPHESIVQRIVHLARDR